MFSVDGAFIIGRKKNKHEKHHVTLLYNGDMYIYI